MVNEYELGEEKSSKMSVQMKIRRERKLRYLSTINVDRWQVMFDVKGKNKKGKK